MKIQLHDLKNQYLAYKNEIDTAIQEVLNSSQFIMGEAIYHFERMLGAYLNCKHVISCGSGTDALLLALLGIDIQRNDEVITTPFTFVATAEIISLLGAKPVFADIEPYTYNIDAREIEKKITAKTRAIIPVSLYGQPADIDEINELAQYYSEKYGRKIYVIEDAAQSLGAEYKGKKSGNLCDIAALSFFPTKPLGCYGDGGAIVVQDDNLFQKIKSLRVHGQTERYYHKYIGFNCRLDTLQAAILNVKLKYLAKEVTDRQNIAAFYSENFQSIKQIAIPYIKNDRNSVYAQYSLRTPFRQEVIEDLKNNNIPTAIHYPRPLHLQECFLYLGHTKGDFPIAEKISNEIFSLPMSAFLKKNEQLFIIEKVMHVFEEKEVTI